MSGRMTIEDAAAVSFQHFPVHMAMHCLRELTGIDRYQASTGIERAARLVAETAAAVGLDAVEVQHVEADGQRRYWTFRAPSSWTPIEGRLSVVDGSGPESTPVLTYPQMPCSIATYSAATGGQDVLLPLKRFVHADAHDDLAGSLAVIPRQVRLSREVREKLERSGAAGFVADALGDARAAQHPDQTGRIELPPGTPLLGFSVDAHRLALLETAAGAGRLARVSLTVHHEARMPMVTAELPGNAPRGVLFVAHLCHVRPGANDNASGVAALLGIAQTIRSIMLRTGLRTLPRPVRFLWAPEFCGAAAYLHHAIGAGHPLPLCVLNLDMVAENQPLCGSPLLVERSPDHVPGFINAVVERCVELVWGRRTRLSQDAAAEWRAVPFAGFSDHAVFVDRSIGVPALQLGHWPDRFNHSSADDIDKTDPEELRSVAAAAAAAAFLIATAGAEEASELASLAARWGVAAIAEIARAGSMPRPGARGCFDPLSPEEICSYLHHRTAVASAAIEATSCLGATTQRRAANWLRAQTRQAALPWSARRRKEGRAPGTPLVRRVWPGPFNLRAALEDMPRPDASWLHTLLETDRRLASVLLALALAIDGSRSRDEVIRYAAYACHCAIPLEVANRFLEALAGAGWIAFANAQS